jgi:RNA polymerase sigma-70 factor, ECF subfamily
VTPFHPTSDEQLMWRVKLESDSQAFAEIMARWQQPIRNLCARMVGDVHRAEDLAQAAFVRLYSARITWQPEARFSTFLWRIALNLCHDELRKSKRLAECSLDTLEQGDPSLASVPVDEPGPDTQLQQRETAEEVRHALLKLAPHYREVVVLRHYERLKFNEISEVLGIAEGTAKSRMFEALNQLTRLLKHLDDKDDKKPWNPKNQSRELLAL